MKTHFHCIFTAGLLLLAGTGFAKERVEERTFPAGSGAALKIETYRGLIKVESSDVDSVRVKVTANTELETDEAAGRSLGNLHLDWQPSAQGLTLRVTNPRETGVSFTWHEKERLMVEITVTVPRSCQLDLMTGDGSVNVGSVIGNVRIKTGAGSISCQSVEGALTARTDLGDIVISRCTGDVNLVDKCGGIRTGPIGGKATAASVSGDIEIMSAREGLVLTTDGGNVIAGIPRQFAGVASLKTSRGSITLNIDPAASVDLNACSVWGKVRSVPSTRSNLPLVIESGGLGRSELVGRINAGGPLIHARASGGQVNIASQAPPFT